MADKKIKFLGVSVYKRKTAGNKKTTRVLGIPVLKRVEKNGKIRKYFLGIKYAKKRLNPPQTPPQKTEYNDKYYGLNNSKLNVVIKFSGGLGDLIIGWNYAKKLIQTYSDPNVCFYLSGVPKLLQVFDTTGVQRIFSDTDVPENTTAFDVFIKVVRFPQILRSNKKKVARFSDGLLDYIFACEKFAVKYPRFFECGRTCDGQVNQIAKIWGKNRVQTPDVLDLFHIDDIEVNIPLPDKTPADFGITQKFITIHRGNDARQNKNCVKLWPMTYYRGLVQQLKKHYPDYTIVQLGVSADRCPAIDGADVNLVGKTTLSDVALLLKHSHLHIDGEGGFAHLRHTIHGGPSVVLFGPTDPVYYGYRENINLSSNACSGCEWVREKWLESCVRGMSHPICMYTLTPDTVFQAIDESGVLNEKM